MRRHATPTRRPRRPLLVTADERLLDDLLRLAAAAGAEVEVAADPADARGRFSTAPLVMVGADQAPACLRARLPRRARVVIVGRSGEQTNPWAHAEALGAAYVALLPDAEPWLVERLATGGRRHAVSRRPRQDPRRPRRARGGAGASVLAAGLAITAGNVGDLRSLLVDADPLGGGADLILGWEDVAGLRWPRWPRRRRGSTRPRSCRRCPAVATSPCCPATAASPAGLSQERWPPRSTRAAAASDLVVADLPRSLDDAAVLALRAADRVPLVVPPSCVPARGRRVAATVTPSHRRAATGRPRPCTGSGCAPGRSPGRLVCRSPGPYVAEPDLPRRLEQGTPPAGNGRGRSPSCAAASSAEPRPDRRRGGMNGQDRSGVPGHDRWCSLAQCSMPERARWPGMRATAPAGETAA